MPNQGRNRGQITAAGNTALAAGNFVLGAGWGTVATLAIGTGATDVAGNFTITASTTGVAQATATVVITYATPYATAPRACLVNVTTNAVLDEGHAVATSTTTALTITYSTIPVDTKLYKFTYALVA